MGSRDRPHGPLPPLLLLLTVVTGLVDAFSHLHPGFALAGPDAAASGSASVVALPWHELSVPLPVDRYCCLVFLGRALDDPGPLPLPAAVADLLRQLAAPPRLAAHLRIVHDVAASLRLPGLDFDRDAVLFGAATHDIGKVIHVSELSEPGSRHEAAGCRLLIEHGFDERLARFAANHGSWTLPGISTEDLVVSLADKIWKAQRVSSLEDLVVERLCAGGAGERWQAWMALDDVLELLARDADARLRFQNAYPIVA